MPAATTAVRPLAFRLVLSAFLATVLIATPAFGLAVSLPVGVSLGAGASAADLRCGPYEPVPPLGGVVRAVSSQDELTAALAAAQPGDTINLATGVYTRIIYRRSMGHRSGKPGAPIVIQAARNASPIIDPSDDGNPSGVFAVTVERLAHVSVRGLEIRNGFFGVASRGSASITFEHNHIHRLGQVGIHIGAIEGPAGLEPSSATVIRCNSIHHSGMLEPEYGEGIYLGSGGTDVVDRTSGVLIEGNEIHSIANEAIDVKRYTTDVTIRDNLIHDVTPYYGGAISLGLNKNSWGPGNYLVEHNRIWNVSSGRHYAQAIAVAHGPTVIRHNVMWNIGTRITDTWPWTATIQVHGDDNGADWAYGFGNPAATSVEIVGNTVIGCNQGCIDSYTDPGQIRPTLTVHSNIVDRASTGDAANKHDKIVSAADLVGPVTGDADSGSGPGSGLTVRADPSPPVAPPPTSSTTATTARPAPIPTATTPVRSAPIPTATTPVTAAHEPIPGTGIGSTDRSAVPALGPESTVADQGNDRWPARPNPSGVENPTGPYPPPTEPRSTPNATRSTSTTRSTAEAIGRPEVVPGWRRGPSELRLFLDLNLGPASSSPSRPEVAASRSPVATGGPRSIVASSTIDGGGDNRTTTTVVDQGSVPAGGSTTSEPRSAIRPQKGSGRGESPSTTRPGSPVGLTTVDGSG